MRARPTSGRPRSRTACVVSWRRSATTERPARGRAAGRMRTRRRRPRRRRRPTSAASATRARRSRLELRARAPRRRRGAGRRGGGGRGARRRRARTAATWSSTIRASSRRAGEGHVRAQHHVVGAQDVAAVGLLRRPRRRPRRGRGGRRARISPRRNAGASLGVDPEEVVDLHPPLRRRVAARERDLARAARAAPRGGAASAAVGTRGPARARRRRRPPRGRRGGRRGRGRARGGVGYPRHDAERPRAEERAARPGDAQEDDRRDEPQGAARLRDLARRRGGPRRSSAPR